MRTNKDRSGSCISEELFEIHAVGFATHKRKGEIAEATFLAKASSFGFGVAKPWGDSERYDFILDSGHNFWRVQVKSCRVRRGPGYRVNIGGGKLAPYSAADIDFLVVYILPAEAWYVIPIEEVASRVYLSFYPGSKRAGLNWEKYREAWCLMACPRDEDGPSEIIVPRCCNQGPTLSPICPIRR